MSLASPECPPVPSLGKSGAGLPSSNFRVPVPMLRSFAKLCGMMTVREVAERLSLTEWQTRRLLYALRDHLQEFSKGGQGRALLLDQAALRILERGAQLHKEGVTLQDLSKIIASELGQEVQNGHNTLVLEQATSGKTSASWEQELLSELRARLKDAQDRIESLERDKAYLQAKLDEALAKLPALPPPSASGQDVPRLSRWQALKIALLG